MLLGVLGMLFDLEDDITVIGKAVNGEEACTLIQQLKLDVV